MTDMRNDSVVQDAAKALFLGCAPERKSDLDELWRTLRPEFQVHEDNHADGDFIFDAGAYRYVRFNPRAMRLFWLGAFILWEAFRTAPGPGEPPADWTRLVAMLATFTDILNSDDPESVPLPSGVPEPGTYPDAKLDTQARAPAELATIATGWAFLHEVRHLRHQQEGTSTNPDLDTPDQVRAEETSCDLSATTFLIDQIPAYATQSGYPVDLVHQKRQLAIYAALFTIALVTKDRWATSPSHPALKDRLEAAKALFGANRQAGADDVARVAFGVLGGIWPGAPAF